MLTRAVFSTFSTTLTPKCPNVVLRGVFQMLNIQFFFQTSEGSLPTLTPDKCLSPAIRNPTFAVHIGRGLSMAYDDMSPLLRYPERRA